MINHLRYLTRVFLFCTVVTTSCKQERQPCLTPQASSLTMRTVRIAADKVVDSPFRAIVFKPDAGAGSRATAYAKSATFALPLSPVSDSCRWFVLADTAAGSALDTIAFIYRRDLNFISNACGYNYRYQLNAVTATHNFIDSVKIQNGTVSNDAKINNLQVFIHPAP